MDNIHHDSLQNQLQSINSSDINSTFFSKTALSIKNNLQTPTRESSITNSEVPNYQIHFETPSDNPTLKKKHSAYSYKYRKPECNNMLQFSNIDELDAKFDAIKSLVPCKIFNLANTLGCLSLVLHETLKTLEKLHVRNSKLLQKNFEFLRKEILSKDKIN